MFFTFFVYYIRIINLSLNELKPIAKSKHIKYYKNKSENDSIKILSQPKPILNLSKKKITEIKKDFSKLRYRFSKPKINEFRRSLYNINTQKNPSTPEIKETEKIFLELEKNLSGLKKYYEYDDTEYRGIRDMGNLFNGNLFEEIDEDYYKPTKTKSAFNGN